MIDDICRKPCCYEYYHDKYYKTAQKPQLHLVQLCVMESEESNRGNEDKNKLRHRVNCKKCCKCRENDCQYRSYDLVVVIDPLLVEVQYW